MIILEGADNSGKSTLANLLGYPVIHPGVPPRTLDEALVMCGHQAMRERLPLVHDRVTSISSQVYRDDPQWNPILERFAMGLVRGHNVLVYCRPPLEKILDFSTHQIKDHEDPRKMEALRARMPFYVAKYDKLMYGLRGEGRVIYYDYTKNDGKHLVDFIKGLADE